MAVVEFRTGEEEIADHLAEMMVGLDTFKMTYEEAIEAMNERMLQRHVQRQYDAIITGHFRRDGGQP